jgi:hypothetical protein
MLSETTGAQRPTGEGVIAQRVFGQRVMVRTRGSGLGCFTAGAR